MEIFTVTKEKLGFDSKKFSAVLVVFFIVLPVSFMVSLIYRNSTFELSQGFGSNAQNATSSGVEPNSLDPGIGQESDSRNVSFDPASNRKPDVKLVNGTANPGIGQESGSRNVSSEPASKRKPDVKLLNGTANSGIGKESGSRNESIKIANDYKFLEGLYPPGLDERSCLSRSESILYRKTSSNHKTSPYLLSKLREYEHLHKRCGPYTKAYNRKVKKLEAKDTSRKSTNGCKYIVWLPANGLGNRIISMAATFLYALLTKRVLLVDHGTDMADLFCEPFPNTTWILPQNFPLKQQFGVLKMRRAHSFGSMLKTGIINMSLESLPSHLYLNLDHSDYDLDKKLFYCDMTEPLLRKVNWLLLRSDQYFSPNFFLSQSYKEEVSKLFPEKDAMFHHLSHYLFNPSNEAWGLITRFYDAYLAKADKRVGLQIRVFNANTTKFQTIIDQILACTLKEKILPEVEKKKYVLASKSKNKTSKAILVTCLHSEFYGNLSNMYWSRATVTGEVIGVYQASHEEYQHFGDNMHNMKAWAEMYLLSLSDLLVTSGSSTFGYVAQGLGRLKPWILYKTDGKNIPNPPCGRDLSTEPCFHFPKTYDCQAKVKIDAGALFPYLRHCKDLNWGVKLVADDHQQH